RRTSPDSSSFIRSRSFLAWRRLHLASKVLFLLEQVPDSKGCSMHAGCWQVNSNQLPTDYENPAGICSVVKISYSIPPFSVFTSEAICRVLTRLDAFCSGEHYNFITVRALRRGNQSRR